MEQNHACAILYLPPIAKRVLHVHVRAPWPWYLTTVCTRLSCRWQRVAGHTVSCHMPVLSVPGHDVYQTQARQHGLGQHGRVLSCWVWTIPVLYSKLTFVYMYTYMYMIVYVHVHVHIYMYNIRVYRCLVIWLQLNLRRLLRNMYMYIHVHVYPVTDWWPGSAVKFTDECHAHMLIEWQRLVWLHVVSFCWWLCSGFGLAAFSSRCVYPRSKTLNTTARAATDTSALRSSSTESRGR